MQEVARKFIEQKMTRRGSTRRAKQQRKSFQHDTYYTAFAGDQVMRTRRDKGRINGPFVPMLKSTMNTDAWRAMSHGARSLVIALKGRYNSKLANAVYLSTRDATKELGSFSRRDNVRRWFREAQYYGFIVMVSPGYLGVEGRGKAPHWRLTDVPYLGNLPTRDFERWSGEIFREQKSPKHYQTKKQNPGPYGVSTVAHSLRRLSTRNEPAAAESGPPGEAISEHQPGPPAASITSLTTPLAALSSLSAQRQRLNDLSARLAVFAPDRVALPATELGEKERL